MARASLAPGQGLVRKGLIRKAQLRRGLCLAGLVALAGCGFWPGARTGGGTGASTGGGRDASVMIASAALFDPVRFQGEWYEVAGLGPGCASQMRWQLTGPGRFALQGQGCGGQTASSAQMIGPGRIALAPQAPARAWPRLGQGEQPPLWVLWVDADYRVAALGTPSGQVGMILARSPRARGDLLNAARVALDFNGYDLAAIRPR